MKFNTKNRYSFADGLRGLAALWVVLYHLYEGNHIKLLSQYIGSFWSMIIFEHGNLGVPIFFVLSGFVMAVTTRSKKIDAVGSVRFMLRRLVRLSPPYYFAILLSLIVLWIKAHQQTSDVVFPNLNVIFSHLFYVQGFFEYQQINVVYWTLCYEIQFYLIFSLVIYFVSRLDELSVQRLVVIVAITLPGLLWLLLASNDTYLAVYVKDHLIFIRYWYAFSAGALVGWSLSKNDYIEQYLRLFYVLIIIAGYILEDGFAITAGITAFVLHWATTTGKMETWLNIKSLQMLGLVSYSLYLIHNNITGIFGRIFRHFFEHSVLSDLFFAIACIFVCFAISFLMYRVIEKPFIKISQNIKY